MAAKVEVYGKPNCGFCTKAKLELDNRKISYEYKDVSLQVNMSELLERAEVRPKSVPQIYINNELIGGYNELVKYIEDTNFTGTGYSLS